MSIKNTSIPLATFSPVPQPNYHHKDYNFLVTTTTTTEKQPQFHID